MAISKSEILLESGTNEVEFIEFYIGGISYGINVAKVQRVVPIRDLTVKTLPHPKYGIEGVIYDHEKPITLIHLRNALNLSGEIQDDDRQLVLIASFNRQRHGFLIDGISKIHRTSWEKFEPMESVFFDTSGNGGYVNGTITLDGRIILILDFERLILDFDPEAAGSNSTPVESSETLRERREKVQVVYAEDSGMVRRMTMDILREAGYTNVHAFENGKSAMEFLEQKIKEAGEKGCSLKDLVNAIVTDIEMPQMDGLTLCKNIKSRGGASHIPAVMVYSSLINREMSAKCQSVGADAQLSKPHGTEIIEILDKLCFGEA